MAMVGMETMGMTAWVGTSSGVGGEEADPTVSEISEHTLLDETCMALLLCPQTGWDTFVNFELVQTLLPHVSRLGYLFVRAIPTHVSISLQAKSLP